MLGNTLGSLKKNSDFDFDKISEAEDEEADGTGKTKDAPQKRLSGSASPSARLKINVKLNSFAKMAAQNQKEESDERISDKTSSL